VAAACRAHDALLMVDGVQMLGAAPVDAGGVDFYCASVFKWLLSGFGLGILVVRDRVRGQLHPLFRGYNNPEPSTDLQASHVNYPGLQALSATLEYLETRGVPVVGYRTDEFPAFWSRSSGLPVPVRLDSAEEIARMLEYVEDGAVICNPVDAADEIPPPEMAGLIDAAVTEAAGRGITGKAVTPYILARILEMSGGRSLRTNIALVKSNARLAAEIAAALPGGPRNTASESHVA